MIRTLAGSNTFLLQRELQKISSDFVAAYGDFELERIDAENIKLSELQARLQSLPFFGEKKCLIVDRPHQIDGFSEVLSQITSYISDNVDIVLVEPSLDKRTRYYKDLKKLTQFTEFSDLDEPALVQWLVNQAKTLGATLSLADARYLVARVGANQYGLFNELEKLAAYSSTITRQSIDLLSDPTPQTSIFDLLDKAFSGDAKRALALYDDQRSQKVEPQIILAMLARQLHTVALIKTAPVILSDNDIAKDNKLHPFAVKKAKESSRHISTPQLMAKITELRDIDRQQKTKNISLDDALRYFLLHLSIV